MCRTCWVHFGVHTHRFVCDASKILEYVAVTHSFSRSHIHFLVFEAWFTIARSRLFGATNVYDMSLYVAHSQSYQLYQMAYLERQKFDKEEDDVCVE